MLWEMNFYFQLLCVIVLTFGGKKLQKGGHGPHPPPPQPSSLAMVLKEHKTMDAPVLVGNVQSLISLVTREEDFTQAYVPWDVPVFICFPLYAHPFPVEK